MGGRWNPIGFQFLSFLVLIFGFLIQGFRSLNSEGLALLEFWARIDSDPYGAFACWNPNDSNPCTWSGVHCVDGKVQMLDLNARSLVGTLAPALAKLSELRSLVLSKNRFFGVIPKELGQLKKLELLDLRSNYLFGTIPAEITSMLSLKMLLLGYNKFEDSGSVTLGKLNMFCNLKSDQNLTLLKAIRVCCVNRKLGHCIWQSSNAGSSLISVRGAFIRYLNAFPILLFNVFKDLRPEDQQCCSSNMHGYHSTRNLLQLVHRRLAEQPKNIEATAAGDASSNEQILAVPMARSSGSYPAVPNAKKNEPPPLVMLPMPPAPPLENPDSGSPKSFGKKPASEEPSASGNVWKYLIIIPCVAIVLAAIILLLISRKRAAKTIRPWKTGISGQLQKAFVTGVPKLNQPELETACEDFSNIIQMLDGCVIYKGTLSSGVEIAVAAAVGKSSEDWSRSSDRAYRKRIDTLSRVNHKNFINLIGYCEEKEPFTRMMVFEYAPNGALSEHLHVKEMEHLDWISRMRIIMGVAYCLQYMHHDLNPPVPVTNLVSSNIYLTDDYAAKIGEVNFISKLDSESKVSSDDDGENFELLSAVDPEANVYNFGILLLEIISAKPPRSDKEEPIENWAAQYLKDKRDYDKMVDPSLSSFKPKELEILCEVVQECIEQDARKRPTMKEVTAELKEVINISSEQAAPRLSPLWWAELEILSQEAA